MPHTLDNRFRPSTGARLGLRLCLTPDAVELRRFGVVVRRVLLGDIEDVTLSRNSASERNIALHVRGGDDIVGHVEAVSLWKFALRDRLGLELMERAPASQPPVKTLRAA